MALQTSQLFIDPQCSYHFTSEKFPASSLYTSLNLSPAKSLSCHGIASTALRKGKRDSPLALHLPFDDTADIPGLASEEIKEVLPLTSKLCLKLDIQPLLPIHGALDVLPEWVWQATLSGTILVLDLLDTTLLHLLNNLM